MTWALWQCMVVAPQVQRQFEVLVFGPVLTLQNALLSDAEFSFDVTMSMKPAPMELSVKLMYVKQILAKLLLDLAS